MSGVHGIEGFAGSAVQLQVLDDSVACRGDFDLLLIHAMNPFGFENRRRVNEDNIDINRNFIDHSNTPSNTEYDMLHAALVPHDIKGPARVRADRWLASQVASQGVRSVQAAITRGQYRHPDGLFYGGNKPCWSNRIWRSIIAEKLSPYTQVAFIDIHTGLGQWARGETIFRGGDDSRSMERAFEWYGSRLTSSEAGSSSSTPIQGNTARALIDGVTATTLVTAITLEFGTIASNQVFRALQADNWIWLNRSGGVRDEEVADVSKQMREAFAPEDSGWQQAVLEEAASVIASAARGLRQNDTVRITF